MEKETLEEAAEKYVNSFEFGIAHPRRVCKNAFINGAKWQQERMYSEEDLKSAFLDGWELRDGDLPFPKAKKKWFEKFKNK